MFNKFELIGIAVSVMAMAIGLFILRVDTSFFALTDSKTELASVAGGVVVVDGNSGTDTTALKNALLNSVGPTGTLEKLVINDVVFGTGEAVKSGDTITVNYIGTLQDGQEFDNSFKRGTPFTFTVGAGKVIKGLEEGIIGMKVGGKRILVVPAEMGYGTKGYGPVPGGASLVFALDLVAVK